MRIISGIAKGRHLKVPSGREVRPTSDRVKESLFSILGDKVVDAWVIDFFAGSGALGLEALSRGASHAVFVEPSPRVRAVLKDNIDALGFGDRATVLGTEAKTAISRLNTGQARYDMVFLDPPYASPLLTQTLLLLENVSFLRPAAWIIAEHAQGKALVGGQRLHIQDTRRYGDTVLTFFEHVGETERNGEL